MQKEKQGIEIRPLSPSSTWDTRIPILIFFLIGVIGSYLGKERIAFFLAFLLGFTVFILLRNRRVDSETRRRNWLIFLPVTLGLAFSFYPFASYAPALIGFGITALVVAWFLVFRYPPELRSAIKHLRVGETLKALQLVNLALSFRYKITFISNYWLHINIRELSKYLPDCRQAVCVV